MKKGFFRRGMVLLLAAVMVMGMSVSAFAADGGNATQVTIADGDTPYISFGADLRADEKAKVLELFGLTEADLEKCNVNTVTMQKNISIWMLISQMTTSAAVPYLLWL